MKVMLKELLIHILGVDFRYPVGSYYETSNANFNPNTAWGGTWVQDSKGRVLVAYDPDQTEFNSAGKTGGEKTHTLTVNEMPSHRHRIGFEYGANPNPSYGVISAYNQFGPYVSDQPSRVENTGGGQSHNNLQPYTVVYRWHRTA